MSENMKFKRKVLSRKKIISSFLVVLVLSLCLGGFMYGLADSFEDFADIRIDVYKRQFVHYVINNSNFICFMSNAIYF